MRSGSNRRGGRCAVRVAGAPAEEFEALAESEKPATATELAEARKKSQPAKRDGSLIVAGCGRKQSFKKSTHIVSVSSAIAYA